ncbi:MAG TPA: hypothetical protein VFN61_15305 [Acidimicrobiales bacterium]|nr:hypothetical protein [Acidimicrobiales bacterium]
MARSTPTTFLAVLERTDPVRVRTAGPWHVLPENKSGASDVCFGVEGSALA